MPATRKSGQMTKAHGGASMTNIVSEKRRKYMKKWKEEHKTYDSDYYKKNIEKKIIYREAHKEEKRLYVKAYRDRIRQEVLNAYGKKCVCCGEKEKMFLAIDHVNGGGGKARKEKIHGHGTVLYLWIIRNKFPSEFQILCHNCNMAKGIYGKCPHEENKK